MPCYWQTRGVVRYSCCMLENYARRLWANKLFKELLLLRSELTFKLS